MDETRHKSRHFDTQAFVYRSIIQISLILGIGLLVKLTFIDIIRMSGVQMIPTVLSGDRLMIFRTPYLPVFKNIFKPGYKKPVLFRMPFDNNRIGCLRVAAKSTDTVSIDSGMFFNTSNPSLNFPIDGQNDQVLPEQYSPRDHFRPFRIPSPGDTLRLDSVSIRDFFFFVSVIRQENQERSITVKPLVLQDDSLRTNYSVSGFSIYSGPIDSVPDDLKNDWFFWFRLEQFLKQANPEKTLSLSFAVKLDGVPVHEFIVKNNYVFLLADNWNSGFDSRYFGPVKSSNIIGRVFSVLWSYHQDSGKKGHIRLNRLGKIIS